MNFAVRGSHLVTLVTAAMLSGCATPAPLVRLYPNLPDVVWVSGRASVTRENGGVRVAVAFDHQDGGTLGVRVEIENGTAAALDVDPSQFAYTPCLAMAVGSCGPTQFIVNPEQVLLGLDEQQSREKANAANSQAALGTLVILSAVADVATLASGHADSHTGDATVASAALMQSDAVAHDSRVASLSVQQSIWANEAFRHNTLLPGRGTAGRVYLPIHLQAGVVWLHVRTGGHVFSFPFQQVVTRLGPAARTDSVSRR